MYLYILLILCLYMLYFISWGNSILFCSAHRERERGYCVDSYITEAVDVFRVKL